MPAWRGRNGSQLVTKRPGLSFSPFSDNCHHSVFIGPLVLVRLPCATGGESGFGDFRLDAVREEVYDIYIIQIMAAEMNRSMRNLSEEKSCPAFPALLGPLKSRFIPGPKLHYFCAIFASSNELRLPPGGNGSKKLTVSLPFLDRNGGGVSANPC